MRLKPSSAVAATFAFSLALGFGALASTPLAMAGAVTAVDYYISGGSMNGTLDGVEFANATWTISGAGAWNRSEPGLLAVGSTTASFTVLPVVAAPVITIDDGVHHWSVSLQNSGTVEWFVGEVDYSGFFGPGTVGYGFLYLDGAVPMMEQVTGFGFLVIGAGSFGTLAADQDFSLSGMAGGGSMVFATSGGDLNATVDYGSGSGQFIAGAIPEPANAALLAGAALLGGLVVARRRRG